MFFGGRKLMSRTEKDRLSLIVPTLNEEGNVVELLERIDRTMREADVIYEVIFVDDHSTDQTRDVVNSFLKKYPITLHTKKGERGKAYSLLEGFGYARYELLAILDADLQYPPETLTAMLRKMRQGADIVVANRVDREVSFVRKLLSRGFSLFFSRFLHGLDCDVQAGLKVFRKEILQHVPLAPSPWTFDLEFLVNARSCGYRIASVDMPFADRRFGESKVVVWKAMYEIGWNAIVLKFRLRPRIRIAPTKSGSMVGAGVVRDGKRFVTHTTLDPEASALDTFTPWQKALMATGVVLVAMGLFFAPLGTGIVVFALLSTAYFLDMCFSFYLVAKSLKNPPEIHAKQRMFSETEERSLPVYSILCPLYKEADMLSGFLAAIDKLNWPKDKLDVLFLLEENDRETINRAEQMNLPLYVRVVVVPDSQPKTKPKACNYGLAFARGEYVVIYDAEDLPEPFQLKKAYIGFQNVPEGVKCLQAKLGYFNPDQNLLTRLFTAEYSLWFDVVLPGLQSINTTIPLGGTSNHFRRKDLLELEGWDPFNVTEDCDLGVRMFKRGYRTAIIDSVTLEEANSKPLNWIRQRSRWIKGYMQTYLVHMRHPLHFFRESGIHTLFFQLMIGLRLIFILINPLLWLMTFVYFAFNSTAGPIIEALFPSVIFYIAVVSMIFGNFLAFYYYMIGCAKRRHWPVVKYVFFVPVYWLMGSVAAGIAVYQLFTKPHYWEKTHHGLHVKAFPQLAGVLRVQRGSSTLGVSVLSGWLERVSVFFGGLRSGVTEWKGWRVMGQTAENFSHLFRDVFLRERAIVGRRRRILIFNWRDTRHEFAGGAEVYIHEMAKRWVAEGSEVTLFCGNDGRCLKDEVVEGVRVVRRGGFYLVYAWAFVWYFLHFRGRYDVIIDCQNGIPFFTPLYAREPVYCLMHHVHQTVFFHSLSLPLALLASFLEKIAMPLVYWRTPFITVSESSRRGMEMLGVGKAGIRVVPPGANLERLSTGEKSAHPTVLYLGRLKAYKSVDVLIRAFALVVRHRPEAMLIIAGDGEEARSLRKLAHSLGLSKHQVIFMGKVSEDTKLRLLQMAWVLVNPSLMEGWGMVTIEANACGTPVIASNVPGLRDSVHNPHTGYLVRYGDSLALARSISVVLSDARLRSSMGRKALAWARKFEWQKSSRRFFRLLRGAYALR
jgi:cellulose synthase/poly-beta-1,6-N-acetylglucosamine synthase-like glycosyltransferase/glycosyltransferase involved in cell wall biosynthesis